jgi:hypothetical protein
MAFFNKKRIIFWAVSLAVIFLTAYLLYYFNFSPEYKMYQMKKPFIEDAENSLGEETPMETYHAFREALKNGNKEKALQYIFLNDREKYKEDFNNQEMVQAYLDMPEDLKKDSESECTGEAFACEKRAVYCYEYEVTGERKEVDLGNGLTGVKEPGTYKSCTSFIKNLEGKWQISSL